MAGMHSPLRHPAGRSSDFIVHIFSSDHWILKGSVSHVQSGRTLAFQSMMEMILTIQTTLDQIGGPQSATAPRHWSGARPELPARQLSTSPAGPHHAEPTMADSSFDDTDRGLTEQDMPARRDMMPEAILASFLLRIQFRQNASWQGTLVWVESKESCAFRSLLELVMLIAQALITRPAQEIEIETPLIAKTQMINEDVF